jgi:hypothetical protein
MVLEIAVHTMVAIQSPRDARVPKDEREQLIELRATRLAFYVLLSGMHSIGGQSEVMWPAVRANRRTKKEQARGCEPAPQKQ